MGGGINGSITYIASPHQHTQPRDTLQIHIVKYWKLNTHTPWDCQNKFWHICHNSRQTTSASSLCHQLSPATTHSKVNILYAHPKSTPDRLSAHADLSNNRAMNRVQYGNKAKQGFHNRPQNSYSRATQPPCINSHHGSRVTARKSGIPGLA